MKSITFHLAALVLSLIPATLGAQNNTSESVNYYAEFADLMHDEMDATAAPVAASHTNRFPAFVHYREVMKGQPQDFPAAFANMLSATLPAADEALTEWAPGCTAYRPKMDGTSFPLTLKSR